MVQFPFSESNQRPHIATGWGMRSATIYIGMISSLDPLVLHLSAVIRTGSNVLSLRGVTRLCTQALEILTELHALTGSSRYVFPGARTNGRPMSDNAILATLRRMGYAKDEMSGHGFRAMARTILDEILGVRPDYIEHQLAHAVRDPNGRAYNRTAHLEARRNMMQQWADYLDKIKAGAAVIRLRGEVA